MFAPFLINSIRHMYRIEVIRSLSPHILTQLSCRCEAFPNREALILSIHPSSSSLFGFIPVESAWVLFPFQAVSSKWSSLIYFLRLICIFFFQGGKKLERARDLFEQVLEGCPAKFAKSKLHFLMKIRS